MTGRTENLNVQELINKGMMPHYNSSTKREEQLPMVSYGRNIQRMVNYCLTIEDRHERTMCAYNIALTMQKLRIRKAEEAAHSNPNLQQKLMAAATIDDHILWDHMYYMSNFKLDIDYPNGYKPIEMTEVHEKVNIPNKKNDHKDRRYGKNVKKLIEVAVKMEDGEKKDALITQIGNFMKKRFIADVAPNVTDSKIFDDMEDMVDGKLNFSAENIHLISCEEITELQNKPEQPSKTSKKKKKK